MKKKSDDILGRVVMVHPFLTTDPIQKQGEIGKILAMAASNEAVAIVEFKDGKKAAYFTDGLLTLYPKSAILQGLQSKGTMITAENRKLTLSIYRLVEQRKTEEALKEAIKNDTTRFLCATRFADWMEMKKEQRKNLKNHRGSNTM
jgi:hypothetical protein